MSDAENMRQRLLDIFDGDRATFADRLRFVEYLDGIEAENAELKAKNEELEQLNEWLRSIAGAYIILMGELGMEVITKAAFCVADKVSGNEEVE